MSVFVGLGSNLGDRLKWLAGAVSELRSVADGTLVVSHVYETAAWGAPGPAYLNAVVRFSTTFDPRTLLEKLLDIESRSDRERLERSGPRTLDLDLLAHGDAVMDEPFLTVPHPRIAQRRFVLVPWAEIDPEFFVPGLDCIKTLLEACPDPLPVEKFATPYSISHT